jgi:O-acetylhomoserine (thiol)-lyase
MGKHCDNALKLASILKEMSVVHDVNYPGLPDNPYYEIAKKQFNGKFGGLLTFKLNSKEQCFRFIDNLKVAKNLANLGDAKTLVIHPASTIYHECTEKEMLEAGVTENMIRVSVGIEDSKDIIKDFEQALDKSTG